MKSMNFANEEDILSFIKDEKNNVEIVACIISNILGGHYKSFFYVHDITLYKLKTGFPFDASSIELCSDVDVSDFYMKLDVGTCWIEEFEGKNIINALADIKTYNGKDYFKCPRTILKKTCEFVKKCGLFDTIYIGNEVEFFIFDKINYSMNEYDMYLKVFDRESLGCKNNSTGNNVADFSVITYNKIQQSDAIPNSSSSTVTTNTSSSPVFVKSCSPNNIILDGTYTNSYVEDDSKKVNRKAGYFRASPKDSSNLIKYQICRILNNLNIIVQRYHHEVSASQHEISLKYFDALKNADNVYITKHIIRDVAHKFNRTVTFMPKPFTNDNGSGFHCNISLWKDNKNIFYSDNPSTFFLSKECFYFMNGIIKHAKALQAFCNSTVNSYKRLVPGFETSQKLFYSFGSRSAVIRLPLIDYNAPDYKRIEFRLPDMANSPHLCFAAIILAGYDGMKSKQKPLPPLEYKQGKFYISNIFTKYAENAKDFESIKHALKDYCDSYDLTENNEYKDFFTCHAPEDISFSLEESLSALEKDYQFLTVENIFTEEMIREYIQFKRDEITAYSRQVTPNDYHLYFNS